MPRKELFVEISNSSKRKSLSDDKELRIKIRNKEGILIDKYRVCLSEEGLPVVVKVFPPR